MRNVICKQFVKYYMSIMISKGRLISLQSSHEFSILGDGIFEIESFGQ